MDTFVLLIYYFYFRIFRTLLVYLFGLLFHYFGYKDTINFRYLVKIGLSSNLKGCIVLGILPVPRVIRHDGQTTAISIVIHETRSCIELDNAHYLVIYFVFIISPSSPFNLPIPANNIWGSIVSFFPKLMSYISHCEYTQKDHADVTYVHQHISLPVLISLWDNPFLIYVIQYIVNHQIV